MTTRLTLAVVVLLLAASVPLPAEAGNLGSITGTVTTSSGEPIAFADVVLLGTKSGTMTNADGSFQIREIPWAAYELKVSYIGHHPQTQAVRVDSRDAMKVDFRLEPIEDRVYAQDVPGGVPPGEIIPLLSSSPRVQAFRFPPGTRRLDSEVAGPVLSRNQVRILESLLLEQDGYFLGGKWVVESCRCLWRPSLAFQFVTDRGEGVIDLDLSHMQYRMRAGEFDEVGRLNTSARLEFVNFALRFFPNDPNLLYLKYREMPDRRRGRPSERSRRP